MKNLDKLEKHVGEKHKPFLDSIWFLSLVDEMINKPEYQPEIREIVMSFKTSYLVLMEKFDLSMTNKTHIICDHIPD